MRKILVFSVNKEHGESIQQCPILNGLSYNPHMMHYTKTLFKNNMTACSRVRISLSIDHMCGPHIYNRSAITQTTKTRRVFAICYNTSIELTTTVHILFNYRKHPFVVRSAIICAQFDVNCPRALYLHTHTPHMYMYCTIKHRSTPYDLGNLFRISASPCDWCQCARASCLIHQRDRSNRFCRDNCTHSI